MNRPILLISAALLAASATVARSATPSAEGNVISADRAGGIQQLLPPGSPEPKIGPAASMLDYVRWSQNALSRGDDAEAELSLEWAALRSQVDSIEVAYGEGLPPPKVDDYCRKPMCEALQEIGRGDESAAMSTIRGIRRVLERRQDALRTASR